MNAYRKIITLSLLFTPVALTSCADWQTTPTIVDQHHGLAVRQMIQGQTMYPEHSQEPRQVLSLDGQKSEGIINPYRAPTIDLLKGKESMEIDIINQ